MPLVEDTQELGFNVPQYQAPDRPPPSLLDTGVAAFRLENDIVNMYSFLNRKNETYDPTFNLKTSLQEQGLWDDRDSYIGTFSQADLNARRAKIAQERKDRAMLAQSGWTGVGAAAVAGLISPTALIPFMAEGRPLVAAGKGALYGVVGIGAQELALQAAQEERTGEESAFAIAGGAVLGGIIGGAVGFLKPGVLESIAKDMHDIPGRPYTSYAYGADAGAAAVAEGGAGGIARDNWLTRKLAHIGPVTRGISQDVSEVGRFMTSQFSTAGLRLEGNIRGIPSSATGTIEDSIKLWERNLADSIETFDSAFRDYYFEGAAPKFFANTRAEAGALFGSGKLSRKEFGEAVGRAMFANDVSEIPQVAATAAKIREQLYKPLFEEAQKVGVLKDMPGELIGDESYFNRLYNDDVIDARMGDFIDVLSEHIGNKFHKDFVEELQHVLEKEQRFKQKQADIALPEDEALALRENFETRLRALEEGRSEELIQAEEQIASIRAQAKTAPVNPLTKQGVRETSKRELLDAAKAIEDNLGEEFARLRGERTEIRRRLRNLNKNRALIGERRAAKLAKVERLEELQLNTLNRVIRKAEKVAADLEKYSHEELTRQAEALQAQFNELGRLYDKETEAITETAREFDTAEGFHDSFLASMFPNMADTGQGVAEKGLALVARHEERAAKMQRLADRLEHVEALDDNALRDWIKEGLEQVKRDVNEINSTRALRRQRLSEQAAKLDPAVLMRALDEQGAAVQLRRRDFEQKYGALGSFDEATGKTDFQEYAKSLAQQITDKILGANSRIQSMYLILDKRGPELARMLDIPSNYVSKSGVNFSDFLVTDVQRAMRSYLRTLSSDIEVARKFGTADAREWFQRLRDEYYSKVEALKDGTPETIERETAKLSAHYRGLESDLNALLERARRTRGVPKNPRGLATRAGQMMMNLNVLRLMGTVMISSIPDLARPVMKYGLMRTFKDGFVPFISRMKRFEISKREARQAAIGLDTILHSRAHQLYDMIDEFSGRTKLERGVEYATSKIGALALFDHWTSWMKEISSSVALTKFMDSLGILVSQKGTKKELDEATEFLASKGIGNKEAFAIWDELQKPGGSNEVDGVLFPNTDNWENADARRALLTALRSEADDTIVTPGFERPLWMDNTLPGRLVAQFRSFAMSSTTKVLMAGLQARDAAFVQGTIASLALGVLSYYLWAVSTGGQAYEEMLNAKPERWADEAIARSGVLAVFGEFQRIGERIPAIDQFMNFSGQRVTNRAGTSLIEALAGPSFDAADQSLKVLTQLDSPTQGTVHAIRTLLPFQNLFWLRQAFDQVEKAIPVPERRSQ